MVKAAAVLRGTFVRPIFWETLYVVLGGMIVSVLLSSRLYVSALILTPNPRFKVLDTDYLFFNGRGLRV